MESETVGNSYTLRVFLLAVMRIARGLAAGSVGALRRNCNCFMADGKDFAGQQNPIIQLHRLGLIQMNA